MKGAGKPLLAALGVPQGLKVKITHVKIWREAAASTGVALAGGAAAAAAAAGGGAAVVLRFITDGEVYSDDDPEV